MRAWDIISDGGFRGGGARRASAFLFALLLVFPGLSQAAVYERTQLVFGDVELSIRIETALPRDLAFREIEKGFRIARRQDAIFSTFNPDSEISRLNALPKPARNVRVSREMAEVLNSAVKIAELTRNYFDLTFEAQRPDMGALRFVGKRRIDVLRPVRLNPTGIVKGDTVERILTLFKRDRRIGAALIAAGGDIGRFDRSGKTETIPIREPLEKRARGLSVDLGDGAVSTSGQYERGRHVKNTLGSDVEHLQTSVIATDCMTSDGLDNAFLFMPLPEIRETLKSFPGTRAIVYGKNGEIESVP